MNSYSFRLLFILIFVITLKISYAQQIPVKPLRLAVAGLTHGHAAFILDRAKKGKTDIELVGIYEPNKELSERIAKQYNLKPDLFYSDLNKMLDAVKPEAVAAFGSIYEHMMVVEACAPRGIHAT
jgi:predicted dehydrogenase